MTYKLTRREMGETVKVQHNVLGALDRVAEGVSGRHDARLILVHISTLTQRIASLEAECIKLSDPKEVFRRWAAQPIHDVYGFYEDEVSQ